MGQAKPFQMQFFVVFFPFFVFLVKKFDFLVYSKYFLPTNICDETEDNEDKSKNRAKERRRKT